MDADPGPDPPPSGAASPDPEAAPASAATEPASAPGAGAVPADVARRMAPLRTAAFLVLVLAFVTIASASATCAYHATHPPAPAPTTTTIVRDTPDVVVAVRDLARLETASFHIERVIDLTDRQERLFGLVSAEDAILLVAAGDVTAGVDLTELRERDIVVDRERDTVRLVLPPPRVLSTRLDNDRTYVHTRRTDTLARRHENLETRARQEAERTLRQSAVTAGILPRAQTNAARTIESLVRSLGYAHVEIAWRQE